MTIKQVKAGQILVEARSPRLAGRCGTKPRRQLALAENRRAVGGGSTCPGTQLNTQRRNIRTPTLSLPGAQADLMRAPEHLRFKRKTSDLAWAQANIAKKQGPTRNWGKRILERYRPLMEKGGKFPSSSLTRRKPTPMPPASRAESGTRKNWRKAQRGRRDCQGATGFGRKRRAVDQARAGIISAKGRYQAGSDAGKAEFAGEKSRRYSRPGRALGGCATQR